MSILPKYLHGVRMCSFIRFGLNLSLVYGTLFTIQERHWWPKFLILHQRPETSNEQNNSTFAITSHKSKLRPQRPRANPALGTLRPNSGCSLLQWGVKIAINAWISSHLYQKEVGWRNSSSQSWICACRWWISRQNILNNSRNDQVIPRT
jgi:hypothetical protein